MNIIKTDIPDVLIFEPRVFGDARGFFYESFSSKVFNEAVGRQVEFVQDNHSQSQKGVLRGLHYQLDPHAQGKLVRCVEGEVFDVAVDIRRSSPTFGKWVGAVLSAENKRQLWIPEGFAHGFQTLEDETEVFYQMSEFHAPEQARGARWNDPAFGIAWPLPDPTMSDRDRTWPDYSG